jgi:LysM repeat protein
MDRVAREPRDRAMPGLARGLAATMPIVLVGAMALPTLGLGTAPIIHRPRVGTARPNPANPRQTQPTMRTASVVRPEPASEGTLAPESVVVPSSYVVRPGDSVSEIAAHYGLSTPSVLALNGLSWKSLIFPGQVLRLTSAKSPVAVQPAPPASPSTDVSTTPVPGASAASSPPPTAAVAPAITHYTIVRGDTVTAIAKRFGVSVEAILAANRLVASSIIYAGRTLVIPLGSGAGGSTAPHVSALAPAPSGHTEPAQVGAATVPLSPSMAANAKVIIAVGRSLGVPGYGIVIALATAAQESSLENLDYGDRDSVGLFQQRPSMGWGTVAQLTNPAYASELFYGGPRNPNRGRTRGLLDIPGWQDMTLTRAAQAVQVSGAPNAYAKWEASARAWFAELG